MEDVENALAAAVKTLQKDVEALRGAQLESEMAMKLSTSGSESRVVDILARQVAALSEKVEAVQDGLVRDMNTSRASVGTEEELTALLTQQYERLGSQLSSFSDDLAGVQELILSKDIERSAVEAELKDSGEEVKDHMALLQEALTALSGDFGTVTAGQRAIRGELRTAMESLEAQVARSATAPGSSDALKAGMASLTDAVAALETSAMARHQDITAQVAEVTTRAGAVPAGNHDAQMEALVAAVDAHTKDVKEEVKRSAASLAGAVLSVGKSVTARHAERAAAEDLLQDSLAQVLQAQEAAPALAAALAEARSAHQASDDAVRASLDSMCSGLKELSQRADAGDELAGSLIARVQDASDTSAGRLDAIAAAVADVHAALKDDERMASLAASVVRIDEGLKESTHAAAELQAAITDDTRLASVTAAVARVEEAVKETSAAAADASQAQAAELKAALADDERLASVTAAVARVEAAVKDTAEASEAQVAELKTAITDDERLASLAAAVVELKTAVTDDERLASVTAAVARVEEAVKETSAGAADTSQAEVSEALAAIRTQIDGVQGGVSAEEMKEALAELKAAMSDDERLASLAASVERVEGVVKEASTAAAEASEAQAAELAPVAASVARVEEAVAAVVEKASASHAEVVEALAAVRTQVDSVQGGVSAEEMKDAVVEAVAAQDEQLAAVQKALRALDEVVTSHEMKKQLAALEGVQECIASLTTTVGGISEFISAKDAEAHAEQATNRSAAEANAAAQEAVLEAVEGVKEAVTAAITERAGGELAALEAVQACVASLTETVGGVKETVAAQNVEELTALVTKLHGEHAATAGTLAAFASSMDAHAAQHTDSLGSVVSAVVDVKGCAAAADAAQRSSAEALMDAVAALDAAGARAQLQRIVDGVEGVAVGLEHAAADVQAVRDRLAEANTAGAVAAAVAPVAEAVTAAAREATATVQHSELTASLGEIAAQVSELAGVVAGVTADDGATARHEEVTAALARLESTGDGAAVRGELEALTRAVNGVWESVISVKSDEYATVVRNECPDTPGGEESTQTNLDDIKDMVRRTLECVHTLQASKGDPSTRPHPSRAATNESDCIVSDDDSDCLDAFSPLPKVPARGPPIPRIPQISPEGREMLQRSFFSWYAFWHMRQILAARYAISERLEDAAALRLCGGYWTRWVRYAKERREVRKEQEQYRQIGCDWDGLTRAMGEMQSDVTSIKVFLAHERLRGGGASGKPGTLLITEAETQTTPDGSRPPLRHGPPTPSGQRAYLPSALEDPQELVMTVVVSPPENPALETITRCFTPKSLNLDDVEQEEMTEEPVERAGPPPPPADPATSVMTFGPPAPADTPARADDLSYAPVPETGRHPRLPRAATSPDLFSLRHDDMLLSTRELSTTECQTSPWLVEEFSVNDDAAWRGPRGAPSVPQSPACSVATDPAPFVSQFVTLTKDDGRDRKDSLLQQQKMRGAGRGKVYSLTATGTPRVPRGPPGLKGRTPRGSARRGRSHSPGSARRTPFRPTSVPANEDVEYVRRIFEKISSGKARFDSSDFHRAFEDDQELRTLFNVRCARGEFLCHQTGRIWQLLKSKGVVAADTHTVNWEDFLHHFSHLASPSCKREAVLEGFTPGATPSRASVVSRTPFLAPPSPRRQPLATSPRKGVKASASPRASPHGTPRKNDGEQLPRVPSDQTLDMP
eukprot:TRINITY_DN1541_c0_g1_i1.p1 TRINITY_DN1541_c0_g1~~TRINITY_DN1541_c0_g1_i1.p1  ORF type:complete len:1784 (+),score=658.00 TRINITY_DN1541_c0_g1_i1:256-5352(+)